MKAKSRGRAAASSGTKRRRRAPSRDTKGRVGAAESQETKGRLRAAASQEMTGGRVEKINYSVTVQVVGGPSVPIAGVLEVDAYEKIDVTVPAKEGATNGTAEVTVSAGDLASTRLLVMKASAQDGSLSFTTTATGAVAVPLTGPVTLIGGGACSLLAADPDSLTFTNSADTAATVTILVGRKAVA